MSEKSYSDDGLWHVPERKRLAEARDYLDDNVERMQGWCHSVLKDNSLPIPSNLVEDHYLKTSNGEWILALPEWHDHMRETGYLPDDVRIKYKGSELGILSHHLKEDRLSIENRAIKLLENIYHLEQAINNNEAKLAATMGMKCAHLYTQMEFQSKWGEPVSSKISNTKDFADANVQRERAAEELCQKIKREYDILLALDFTPKEAKSEIIKKMKVSASTVDRAL